MIFHFFLRKSIVLGRIFYELDCWWCGGLSSWSLRSSSLPMTFGGGGAFALAADVGGWCCLMLTKGFFPVSGNLIVGRLSSSYFFLFYDGFLSFDFILSRWTVVPLRSNRVSGVLSTYMRHMGFPEAGSAIRLRSRWHRSVTAPPQHDCDIVARRPWKKIFTPKSLQIDPAPHKSIEQSL